MENALDTAIYTHFLSIIQENVDCNVSSKDGENEFDKDEPI